MVEDDKIFIDLANDLISKEKFEYLADVLMDLKKYQDLKHKQDLKLRVLPVINDYQDLVLFQLKISKFLKNNEVEDMSYILEYIKNTKVTSLNDPDMIIKPHIWITVRRKNLSWFCYGEKCLEKGKKRKIKELISLDACSEHKFCKKCLRRHVLKSAMEDIFSVKCEVCIKIRHSSISSIETSTGSSCEKGLKAFNYKDLSQVFFIKDYDNYQKEKMSKKYKQICYFPDCPHKMKPIYQGFFKKFQCGDEFCNQCYAASTINYIEAFINSHNLTDINKLAGIMCPNFHPRSAEILSSAQVKSIISFSKKKLSDEYIENLTRAYEVILPLFTKKYEEFCKRCNTPSNIYALSNLCIKCFKCFRCDDEYHNSNQCRENLEDHNNPKINNVTIPYPGSNGYDMFIECIKLIPNQLYSIQEFMEIENSIKRTVYHNRLREYHYESKSVYFIGNTYAHIEHAKSEIENIMTKYAFDKEITIYSLMNVNENNSDMNFIGESLFCVLYECIIQKEYENTKTHPITHKNKYDLILFKQEKVYTNPFMVLPIRLAKLLKVYNPPAVIKIVEKSKKKKNR